MDHNDTPEDAAFREEVRDWLAKNAPRHEESGDGRRFKDNLAGARAWAKEKASAGYVGFTLPKTVGGRDGTQRQAIIFQQEEGRYRLPRSTAINPALEILMPVLLQHGRTDQAARHIRKMLSGEEMWCQLFSEPGAGSDLAGLRTRAERDGDHWVINGQKVWTSNAQNADFGFLIVRTDPTVPKHRGLSCFLVEMRAPGIEVRPIKQISGQSEFNEVFFTDHRAHHSQMLGAPGDGWKVVMSTLRSERLAVSEMPHYEHDLFDRLFEISRDTKMGNKRLLDDRNVRARLADFYVKGAGARQMQVRIREQMARGEIPGPEASMNKMVMSRRLQEMSAYGLELLGEAGIMSDPKVAPLASEIQHELFEAFGMRIGGGTDDIMRNALAEYALDLPGDLRVDKDRPFNEFVSSPPAGSPK